MTAQTAENLRYRDEDLRMFTNPLSNYFAIGGNEPLFIAPHTALWRGYVGSWEINNGRLYLVALEGKIEGDIEATLATVFPDFPNRVFAHWYSGVIRIPQGELLRYVHGGYASTYERDLLLVIENGVVVDEQIRHNRLPADDGGES